MINNPKRVLRQYPHFTQRFRDDVKYKIIIRIVTIYVTDPRAHARYIRRLISGVQRQSATRPREQDVHQTHAVVMQLLYDGVQDGAILYCILLSW